MGPREAAAPSLCEVRRPRQRYAAVLHPVRGSLASLSTEALQVAGVSAEGRVKGRACVDRLPNGKRCPVSATVLCADLAWRCAAGAKLFKAQSRDTEKLKRWEKSS